MAVVAMRAEKPVFMKFALVVCLFFIGMSPEAASAAASALSWTSTGDEQTEDSDLRNAVVLIRAEIGEPREALEHERLQHKHGHHGNNRHPRPKSRDESDSISSESASRSSSSSINSSSNSEDNDLRDFDSVSSTDGSAAEGDMETKSASIASERRAARKARRRFKRNSKSGQLKEKLERKLLMDPEIRAEPEISAEPQISAEPISMLRGGFEQLED